MAISLYNSKTPTRSVEVYRTDITITDSKLINPRSKFTAAYNASLLVQYQSPSMCRVVENKYL